MVGQTLVAVLTVMIMAAGCAPRTQPSSQDGDSLPSQASPSSQRTLIILARGEPSSMAAKPFATVSITFSAQVRVFNGTLDYTDHQEVSQPYLAEALPRVNSDTWRVNSDGTMQTSYHLRDGLAWHDGTPLTASDFAFAYEVYTRPELGSGSTMPIALMSDVSAPDPRTVVISWRRLYSEAGSLDLSFQALPRHILQEPLARLDAESFVNLPFWTREYVGLGPYKLTKWEPGTAMDAVAFDQHALGAPKIRQLRILFTPDPNSAVAMMLSGSGHVVADLVLSYEHGVTLEQEWAARGGGGTVNWSAAVLKWTTIQFRPEYASPRVLLDQRVRRGIQLAFDRESAMEATTGGRGLVTYTITSPQSPKFAALDAASFRRPFDPRGAQQWFEDAGMTRGPDGFYLGPDGEPAKLEVATEGGPISERDNAITVDGLRRAGIDAFPYLFPLAQARDNQFRALRPGLAQSSLPGRALSKFISAEVPRPENRWGGDVRGGWTNPEYDRLWELYDTALDPDERGRYIAQMERIIADDVVGIPTYFNVLINAYSYAVKGVPIRMLPDAGFGLHRVDTWEWTS